MTDWIKADEKLPEQEGDYLVWQSSDRQHYFIYVSYYEPVGGFSWGFEVLYWAELPAPPNG